MNHSDPPPEIVPSLDAIDARTKHLVHVVELLRNGENRREETYVTLRLQAEALRKVALDLSNTSLRLFRLANPLPLWVRVTTVAGGSFLGGAAAQLLFRVLFRS